MLLLSCRTKTSTLKPGTHHGRDTYAYCEMKTPKAAMLIKSREQFSQHPHFTRLDTLITPLDFSKNDLVLFPRTELPVYYSWPAVVTTLGTEKMIRRYTITCKADTFARTMTEELWYCWALVPKSKADSAGCGCSNFSNAFPAPPKR